MICRIIYQRHKDLPIYLLNDLPNHLKYDLPINLQYDLHDKLWHPYFARVVSRHWEFLRRSL